MNPYFTDYDEYIRGIFGNQKIQKISVNTGNSCPNRDGTISRGGCTYCSNASFTPAYCSPRMSVGEQLEAGKRFFSRKYKQMKYLAYFQSYTNTYGSDIHRLERMWREALDVEDVLGVIVSTRPDSVTVEIADRMRSVSLEAPFFVELGAESSFDETLQLVNRGHTWQQTVDAVNMLTDKGLRVGLHLICGLPSETEEHFFKTVRRAAKLPIDSLKLHHLQIIEGTPLQRQVAESSVNVKQFTLEDYLNICMKVVGMVPRSIAIERFVAQAPANMLVAPKWGVKNYQFTNLLLKRLSETKTDKR